MPPRARPSLPRRTPAALPGRDWVFTRAAAGPSPTPSSSTEAAAAAELAEAGSGDPATQMPLVVAAAAAVPPAITPAPASKPPSGASAASTLQIRKAPEGVWATGSSKKAKGTQSTLPHKLYGITGSESSLTLVLEHLAKRDKLQAVFRVSDFSVEVKVKRRLVLPERPLLLHSGGGFETHDTDSWREGDYLTTGPLELHKLGSGWALDGKVLGEASETGESEATSYEIGRSKLETHDLLHVPDGGGVAQLTVCPRRAAPSLHRPAPLPPSPSAAWARGAGGAGPSTAPPRPCICMPRHAAQVPLLLKTTSVEQEECTPSPPRSHKRTPTSSSSIS